MKKNILYSILLMISGIAFSSCSEEKKDIIIPYPNDVTFEDITLGRFAVKIPDAPFKSGNEQSGIITFNTKKNSDGTFSGFAISNKNWRSYPWKLSPDFAPTPPLTEQQKQAEIDTCKFSVYTSRPNHTGNYLVVCVKDDDAFITLDKPSIVEHVLVANTTYNYLLESYGSIYSGTLDSPSQQYSLTGTKVKNPMIPNTSTDMYGRFLLPGSGGVNLMRLAGAEILAKRQAGAVAAQAARVAGKTSADVKADSIAAATAISKGFVKLTIKGLNGTNVTSTVDYWLAVRPNVDPANPTLNYIAPDWFKVDLTKLGSVTKLVFSLSSSYVDANGKTLYPPFFCLDGIRLKK